MIFSSTKKQKIEKLSAHVQKIKKVLLLLPLLLYSKLYLYSFRRLTIEAEFLDVIGRKVLRDFLLSIYRHLY